MKMKKAGGNLFLRHKAGKPPMDKLNKLEKRIDIDFNDQPLLKNAFIHRSYLNEQPSLKLSSNEKLEFLGDSVLSLITSVHLYENYSDFDEGEYTDIKASIVKTDSLAKAASELELGKYLYLSKGEELNKGRENRSILADCFEALIGAMFLDKGFGVAYKFVKDFLFSDKLNYIINHRLFASAKNRLQEYWQGKYKTLPEYKTLKQTGPEHDKRYKVGVFAKNKRLGEGFGKSKKEAESKAALAAIKRLKI